MIIKNEIGAPFFTEDYVGILPLDPLPDDDEQKSLTKSDCGAGSGNGGGFGAGNTCASGGASTAVVSADGVISDIVQTRFEDFKNGTSDWVGKLIDNKDIIGAHELKSAVDGAFFKMRDEWISSEKSKYAASQGSSQAKRQRELLDRRVSDVIDRDIKDVSQRQEFKSFASEATKYLTEKDLGALKDELKSIRFHSDESAVKDAAIAYGGTYSEDDVIAGFYARSGDGRTAELNLDGVGLAESGSIVGLYQHELAHAVDRAHGHTSESTEWLKAYHSEINIFNSSRTTLSEYAKTDPSEGFAEYGRLVASDIETAIKEFPRSWEVWSKASL